MIIYHTNVIICPQKCALIPQNRSINHIYLSFSLSKNCLCTFVEKCRKSHLRAFMGQNRVHMDPSLTCRHYNWDRGVLQYFGCFFYLYIPFSDIGLFLCLSCASSRDFSCLSFHKWGKICIIHLPINIQQCHTYN